MVRSPSNDIQRALFDTSSPTSSSTSVASSSSTSKPPPGSSSQRINNNQPPLHQQHFSSPHEPSHQRKQPLHQKKQPLHEQYTSSSVYTTTSPSLSSDLPLPHRRAALLDLQARTQDMEQRVFGVESVDRNQVPVVPATDWNPKASPLLTVEHFHQALEQLQRTWEQREQRQTRQILQALQLQQTQRPIQSTTTTTTTLERAVLRLEIKVAELLEQHSSPLQTQQTQQQQTRRHPSRSPSHPKAETRNAYQNDTDDDNEDTDDEEKKEGLDQDQEEEDAWLRTCSTDEETTRLAHEKWRLAHDELDSLLQNHPQEVETTANPHEEEKEEEDLESGGKRKLRRNIRSSSPGSQKGLGLDHPLGEKSESPSVSASPNNDKNLLRNKNSPQASHLAPQTATSPSERRRSVTFSPDVWDHETKEPEKAHHVTASQTLVWVQDEWVPEQDQDTSYSTTKTNDPHQTTMPRDDSPMARESSSWRQDYEARLDALQKRWSTN